MQNNLYTLTQIADALGAELIGEGSCQVSKIASLEKAKPGEISFLVSSRYQLVASSRFEKFLPTTQASAVLVGPQHQDQCHTNKLVMLDPYEGMVKLLALFSKKRKAEAAIHSSAVIGENVQIGENVTVGPHSVIKANSKIGSHTIIESNVVIGEGVELGEKNHLFPNVTIYDDVKIGDRVMIHSGVVIGSDGFGLIRNKTGWEKIPHIGTVVIGNDVEIGANTTIDRGVLDDTVIENGVKLDNLIQIAHGVVIGENTVIAACTGIAGSTRIGKNCMIGGATGISDNVVIADNVIFTGMAQVVKSIKQPGIYSSGTGILPQKSWHKAIARLHNLDELAKKLRKLEKESHE